MTLYHYTALTKDGEQVAGQIEGPGREFVCDQLSKLGHLPIEVSEAASQDLGPKPVKWSITHRRPSSAQITMLTRELAMLLKAGLTLDQALEILQRDAASRSLRVLLDRIRSGVKEGKSLHIALKEAGQIFPPVYTSMVRVAEASGTLDTVLEQIAVTREKEQKLRGKALSATLYPALLVLVAITAVIIMLVVVVPRFKEMILTAGSEIPEASRFVIGLSDWILANGRLLVVAILLILVIAVVMRRQPWVRRTVDRLLLSMPLIGHLQRLALTIRFCRTLTTLLENGVDLPDALDLTKDVAANELAAAALEEAHIALRKGQNFTEPLARSGLFPPVVINMLRVGEETGELSKTTLHLADMYEDKLEIAIQRTFTILEPTIIILVSLFVAGIIMSIIGAVISVNDLAI